MSGGLKEINTSISIIQMDELADGNINTVA